MANIFAASMLWRTKTTFAPLERPTEELLVLVGSVTTTSFIVKKTVAMPFISEMPGFCLSRRVH
jgi:hypothetical protein